MDVVKVCSICLRQDGPGNGEIAQGPSQDRRDRRQPGARRIVGANGRGTTARRAEGGQERAGQPGEPEGTKRTNPKTRLLSTWDAVQWVKCSSSAVAWRGVA